MFGVYSYATAVEVLLDTATTSSKPYHDMIGKVMGRSVIEMDLPEQREYRSLQPSLGPKTMDMWRSRFVSPLLTEMLKELRPASRADLVRGFLFAFPMRSFAAIMGAPPSQCADFHYTANELVTLSHDLEKGLGSAKKLAEIFMSVLCKRGDYLADDLISVLAHAERNGRRLADEEVHSFCRPLMPAGAETARRSSSSTLLVGLLSDTVQFDVVRQSPKALSAAVNEAIEWEIPLQCVPRLATRDTEPPVCVPSRPVPR